ncbi:MULTISPECIES: ABC transporter permease [unclassified Streptomyces]|uniref:ABC transporter permease n=1 Tax=unclassified Streptomyces TaxID=2593676 RepID=UPI00081E662F|nr:ABC transporter permease [Streptomyces sp. LcepLS]SCF01494.1 peptide/nickel transport system permease protein [Streptomyces sp. LcepLS]
MSFPVFLARRAAWAAVVLVLVTGLVFAATAALPGDAVSAVAGADASPAERAAVRHALGLDRPVAERYAAWAGKAVRGDLGTGLVGHGPVAEVLADRLPASLLLAGLTLLLVVPCAAVLGLWAGLRRGRPPDRLVSLAALTAASVPEFVTAALLIAVFSAGLGLLPRVVLVPLGGSPLQAPAGLVLPVLTLAGAGLATATRLVRTAVADVDRTAYVEAARLDGVRGARLALRHVLPNALGPAVQGLALTTSGLVGGAVVVESVFDFPGIGRELQRAVAARDVPMVLGIATALAAVVLLVLLAGDILARLLDPVGRNRR